MSLPSPRSMADSMAVVMVPAETTDLRLREPRLPQGRADLQFPQGPHAGALGGVIVQIAAVQQQLIAVRPG